MSIEKAKAHVVKYKWIYILLIIGIVLALLYYFKNKVAGVLVSSNLVSKATAAKAIGVTLVSSAPQTTTTPVPASIPSWVAPPVGAEMVAMPDPTPPNSGTVTVFSGDNGTGTALTVLNYGDDAGSLVAIMPSGYYQVNMPELITLAPLSNTTTGYINGAALGYTLPSS